MDSSCCDEPRASDEKMSSNEGFASGRRPSHKKQASGIRQDQDIVEEATIIDLNSDGLLRNRSTLHVAFMSFVVASIPYGLATTLFYPLINGGPVTII